MNFSSVRFRDVTDNPQAQKAVASTDLRDALYASAFSQVGLMEFTIIGAPPPEQQTLDTVMGDTPDADLLRQATQTGQTDEVLSSPDQKMFVVVEPFFGGPVACFRSLLENGIIVETTMKPSRTPDINLNPFAVAKDPFSRFMAALVGVTLGKPPLWPRETSPQSGYYLELVDSRDARAVWRRHQERVSEIAQREGVLIPPHNSLDLYACINRRTFQIHEHYARYRGRLEGSAIAGFMILNFSLILLPQSRALIQPYLKEKTFALFGMMGFFLLMALLMFPVLGLIRRGVTPRLPGPKLEPVSVLMEKWRLRD